MEQSILLVIITALISGLLATIITIIWQRKYEAKKHKIQIFETLMAFRYMLTAQENVNALNSIEVAFYKDKAVRKAYEEFIKEAERDKTSNFQLEEKHMRLLEEISKSIGLKDIRWDNIRHFYYPRGLAERIDDENHLRKIQIQSATISVERALQARDNSNAESIT